MDCINKYIEKNKLIEFKSEFYSFYNYVRSFAVKNIRPIDIKQFKKLFLLFPEADRYIFQKRQFNNRKTQLYLFISKFLIKLI